MKFTIIGSSLYGNQGAAAMLESSIHNLSEKFKGAHFSLLSINPREDRKLNTYPTLKIYNAKPLYLALVLNTAVLIWKYLPVIRKQLEKIIPEINIIRNCDVYLDQGGIAFSDGRTKYLPFNVATLLPALILKKEIVKCAQAAGPFDSLLNKHLAKFILPKLTTIVARGGVTHEHLKSIGLKNVVKGTDYAFSLPSAIVERRKINNYLIKKPFKQRVVVGISPSIIVKKHCDKRNIDYVEIMSGFINNLILRNYGVVIIPHSIKLDSSSEHNNDLPLTLNLAGHLDNSKNTLVLKERLHPQDLRCLIGKTNFFIASRLHAMIASLANGVPTLVIGWGHKYREILDQFQLAKYLLDYSQLEQNLLNARFDNLVADSNMIQKRIKKHLPRVNKLASEHSEYIKRILEQNQ